MPTRGLTSGELQILDFVFYDTIDFERHEITTNDKNVGGADNSVTYSDTPHYSHQIWCVDFSDPNADTSIGTGYNPQGIDGLMTAGTDFVISRAKAGAVTVLPMSQIAWVANRRI